MTVPKSMIGSLSVVDMCRLVEVCFNSFNIFSTFRKPNDFLSWSIVCEFVGLMFASGMSTTRRGRGGNLILYFESDGDGL